MTPEFVIVGWGLTILGSGFAAYVGVKVAIAQIQTRLDAHDKMISDNKERIERLEAPYFKPEGAS